MATLVISAGFLVAATVAELAHSLLTIMVLAASYMASTWIVRDQVAEAH